MTDPHEPERRIVTPQALAALTAGTVGFALVSLPFSGRIQAVMVACAAFLGLGAVLIFSSLLANGVVAWVVDRVSR